MSNRKKIITVIATALFSILIVSVLYAISPKTKHKANGFNRYFTGNLANLSKSLDLKFNSYYIAGADNKHIYLGNYTNPALILITDYNLQDTSSIKVNIPDNQLTKSFKLKVDSPNIIIMDGVTPAIMKASFSDLNAFKYTYDSAFFTLCAPISRNTFILRATDAQRKQQVLIKEIPDEPHILKSPNLLVSQVDGYFSTDGTMNYSKELSLLVYTYFYRNEFLCIDTNLNLKFKGKTIDTISQAKINVAFLDSGQKAMMDAPPLLVNKRSSVSGNSLFIYSTLKANNDSKAFDESSAIDVYSLRNSKYRFSFYLPEINGKKINNFLVFKDKIIAIHDHYLAVYKLNFSDI